MPNQAKPLAGTVKAKRLAQSVGRTGDVVAATAQDLVTAQSRHKLARQQYEAHVRTLTSTELRQHAKDMGITGVTSARKDVILARLGFEA